jgi:hypothetical protein
MGNMMDPFRSLDRWASQSVNRAAMLTWCVVVMLGLFVVAGIAAEIWYTAPRPISHLSPTEHRSAPA